MKPVQDHSELLLTAFRYVSGELSADETTAFENELSSNQTARDALADVVELSEAIAVEEFDRCEPLHRDREPVAVHDSRKRESRLGLIIALSVIAVTCALVFNNGRRSEFDSGHEVASETDDPLTVPVDGDADSVLSLSLWSELGLDNAEQLQSDAILADESETLPATENDIPDWLLTAVDEDVEEAGTDLPDEMRELMDDLDRENL